MSKQTGRQEVVFFRGFLLAVMMLLFLNCYGCGSDEFDTEPNPTLEEALGYLESRPGVAWVKYLRNDAFVGFYNAPNRAELGLILATAALKGHRAVNAPCHVFGVPWTKTKPYDNAVAYGSAVASVNKLQELWINEKIVDSEGK